MHCTDFLEHYSEYRDGLIEDQGLLQQLRRHLLVCPQCMRYDARLARGVTVLRSLSDVGPSASFRRRLAARLAAPPPEPFRPAVPATAGLMAALMLVVVAALFLWVTTADSSHTAAAEQAAPPAVVVVSPRVHYVGFADFTVPASHHTWQVQTAVFP
ncbi:MAG: hypothetical protein JSW43_10045 [Gemmatimonadota bacterium]|nr:MAG: hypothetical protein JSW43_10045 [Gemmatimonadota bacterium]